MNQLEVDMIKAQQKEIEELRRKNEMLTNTLAMAKDISEIAKYALWQSDVGLKKAQEIIKQVHDGKYGGRSGIWVQWSEKLEALKENLE